MTNNIYSPKLATYVKISFEGKIKLGLLLLMAQRKMFLPTIKD